MAGHDNERFVLLNHLISRSTARARDIAPPVHSGYDLMMELDARYRAGHAVEYYRGEDHEDDGTRISNNRQLSAIRIRDLQFSEDENFRYVAVLVEHIDASADAFSVVHQLTFAGRALSGSEGERGAVAAHIVVRFSKAGTTDHGQYRCVIEAVPGISRRMIEHLFCRQLRRTSDKDGWDFEDTRKARGRGKPKMLRYTPKLELRSDVGRQLKGGEMARRTLSSMTFTSTAERHQVAQPSDVEHTDFEAAVTYVVKAEQGPSDPSALARWALNIRSHFENRGFRTSLAFRHAEGHIERGAVQAAVDGATDLLMCSRQLLTYEGVPRLWVHGLDNGIVNALEAITSKDELWP